LRVASRVTIRDHHGQIARANAAAPDFSATFHRWFVEACRVAERKPPAIKALVFQRTELLLELMVDRAY
jgi:hypothetical protein